MSLMDVARAFQADFALLGLSNVSVPNGPVVDPPSDEVNYALSVIFPPDGDAWAIGGGGPSRYEGIFQVLVSAPADSNGEYAVQAAVEAIMAHYPRSKVVGFPIAAPTTYAHCKTVSARALGKVKPEWYTYAVRVPWWADV